MLKNKTALGRAAATDQAAALHRRHSIRRRGIQGMDAILTQLFGACPTANAEGLDRGTSTWGPRRLAVGMRRDIEKYLHRRHSIRRRGVRGTGFIFSNFSGHADGERRWGWDRVGEAASEGSRRGAASDTLQNRPPSPRRHAPRCCKHLSRRGSIRRRSVRGRGLSLSIRSPRRSMVSRRGACLPSPRQKPM